MTASTITEDEQMIVRIEGAIFAAPLCFGMVAGVVEAAVPF